MRELFDAGELRFVGSSAELEHPVAFEALLARLRAHSWVVYAKKPFGGAHHLVRSLGLYTHRVAISSSRLLSVDEDAVVFKTRDRQADCRVTPDEFLRRFLLHTLPHRFRKVWHYGLYAPSSVRTRLPAAQDLLRRMNRRQRRDAEPVVDVRSAEHEDCCPMCGYGPLRARRLPPVRGPP